MVVVKERGKITATPVVTIDVWFLEASFLTALKSSYFKRVARLGKRFRNFTNKRREDERPSRIDGKRRRYIYICP